MALDTAPADAVAAVRRNPSAILLATQVLALLAYPFLDSSTAGLAVLGVVQLGVVLAALWAVRSTPALTWVAVLLGVPAMVFTVLEAVWPHVDAIVVCSAVLHAPFYFFISYGMIRYVFYDEHVSTDELFATAAAFTVVAWGFAYVYAGSQAIWPGSFSAGGGLADRSWFELLFLSFTTLTSTGLSDVVPVLDHARSVMVVEQVTGVFYIAFVVARMVALTVARQRAGD